MKLLNKLLPIAAVATAAVAAPVVTSCSTGKASTASADINVLLERQYTRKSPVKAPVTYLTIEDATKAYLTDVKSNPQIIIDDYFATFEKWGKSLLPDYDEDSDKLEGEVTAKIENVDVQNMKLSFELSYSIKVISYDDVDVTKVRDEVHYDKTLRMKNFKFATFCYEYEDYQEWMVIPGYVSITYDPDDEDYSPLNDLDLWLLHNDHNWSMELIDVEWSDFFPDAPYENVSSISYNYKSLYDQGSSEIVREMIREMYAYSDYLANAYIDYEFQVSDW